MPTAWRKRGQSVLCWAPRRSDRQDWQVWDCSGVAVEGRCRPCRHSQRCCRSLLQCDLIHFGVEVIGTLLFYRKRFQCYDCTPEQADSFLTNLSHFIETRYQPHLDFPSVASRNFKPASE